MIKRRVALAATFFLLLAAVVRGEDAGEDLFLGRERGLSVEVLGVAAPAARFGCRNCHGEDGRGGREGATAMPAIDGDRLSRPTSARAAYAPESFHRALTEGVGPGGATLDIAMPRFRLDRRQSDALLAYLRALPGIESRGVEDRAVHFGLLVSEAGGRLAEAYAATLEAALADAPELFGRRIVLRRIPVGAGPADPAALLAAHPVIALVAPTPADAALAHGLAAAGAPVLFPLFPLGGDEDPAFWRALSPDRGRVLAALARRIAEDGHAQATLLPGGAEIEATRSRLAAALAAEGVATTEIAPPPGEGAYLMLSVPPEEATGILAALPAGSRVYGVAEELSADLPDLARRGVGFSLASRDSVVAAEAVTTDRSALDAHAAIVARLLPAVLREAGRDLRRTSMMRAFGRARLRLSDGEWLSYGAAGLAGSDRVRFVSSD